MPAAPTRKLTLPRSDQARLAIGARLQQDRYEIMACLAETGSRNTYVVKDLQVRYCPQCGHQYGRDATFCEHCGLPLTASFYLLLEGMQSQTVEAEARVAQWNLRHPGLINLYMVFSERPVGNQLRTYVLLDLVTTDDKLAGAQKGQPLTALAPVTPQQASAWLTEIGQILDYLHSKQVWFPLLQLQQMLLVGRQVKLAGLEQLKEFSATALANVVAQELRLLAHTWQELIGPQPLTPELATVLQKAQNSNIYPTLSALLGALTAAAQASQLPALQLQVGALTDLGLVRTINEDSLYALTIDQYHNSSNLPIRLYAVADGMGGHAAGETASTLALKQLSVALLTSIQPDVTNSAQPPLLDHAYLLKQACLAAAKAVYDQARKLNVDMGTTLVAVLIDLTKGNIYAANVGDSRLYKLNRSGISQITRDHSMVQLLVEQQQLTPEQARHHPQSNLIYRTLGEKPVVEVDIFAITVDANDYLLLCSDGLSGQVSDQQIYKAVMNSTTPQTACAELVRLARTTGGPDNITALLIKVERATAVLATS